MTKLMLHPEFNLYERNGKAFCSSRLEDLPKESRFGGYVYIIEINDRVKIGRTKNPKRRFKEIQQLSGNQISRFCISPECGNYYEIENSMHLRFKDRLILGEWFNVDFDNAVTELNRFIFQRPKKQKQSDLHFDIEAAANNHLKTVLEENPVIKNYLEANGLAVFYCEKLKEILISNGEGYEIEFSVFMQMFVADCIGHSGSRIKTE